MTDEYVHPGYVLRTLRNDTGTAMKFPTARIVLQAGEQAAIVHSADQNVPLGFTQIGKDVPCDENGSPLVAEVAAAQPDAEADKGKRGKAAASPVDNADTTSAS